MTATGRIGRACVLFIAAATCAAPAPAEVPEGATSADCLGDDGSIRSGATTVRGSLFRSSGPAVLVLHTRGGLNAHARSVAMWLASAGLLAYAPDYFAPAGVTPATFDRQTFTARHTDAVVAHLAAAASCLRAVSPTGKVGVVGLSMGGYIAIALASAGNIDAVVGWYGAYAGTPVNQVPAQRSFTELAGAVSAPVLLLHGEADTEVRVDFARRAQAELESAGVDSELVVYPGVGHGYDQEGSTQYRYDARATADSRARTLALLADALY